MLGFDSTEQALAAEPREMVSVSPELWASLRSLYDGGAYRHEFQAAWANGRAFLRADDALRGRRPRVIEWKGAVRAPGDEVVPADLRVDHVYLVSCKYLSQIVLNTSPSQLFERLLVGAQNQRSTDWYRAVAGPELEALYDAATREVTPRFPPSLDTLTAADRRRLSTTLKGRWAAGVRDQAESFARLVATRSAERWTHALAQAGNDERLLWRLLRIGSAPYFVLGTDKDLNLRLRIETPWDWRQRYRLVSFEVLPRAASQPVIDWIASVEDKHSLSSCEVMGHVEIRWSHGKFGGPPEAKVYLDTPHHRVPGYVTLV
jgi:hypothetical protein